MIKKFKEFINENKDDGVKKLVYTDVDIDPNEIIDRLRSGKITIDFRRSEDDKPVTQKFIDSKLEQFAKHLEHKIKFYEKRDRGDFRITELPYDFMSYEHPVNKVYCYFILVSMDEITLGTLEEVGKEFFYNELPIPETLIKGDYHIFDLDIPSGKMCFCGDWVRDIFVEKEDKKYEYGNDYHTIEVDALEHMNHYLSQGYFYVPDSFSPTLSKKDDTYYLYSSGEFGDDSLGDVIDDINVDSDHTMVIIDSEVLDKKLEDNKEDYEKLEDYQKRSLKYCLDVEPGKYEIKFNWRFGKEEISKTLIYFKITKK